jgi:hypothetical protein
MLELAAVLLSLAALVVSYAALYLTSLSPAEIEVDHVRRAGDLASDSFSGPHPRSHELRLAVFISNTGARGGLLEEIRVADFEWLGDGDPYWVRFSRSHLTQAHRAVETPTALEAGDVETAVLFAELQPAGGSVEDQAAQLSGMTSIAVTIHWTFVRTRGLPVRWRLVPERFKRVREHVQRSARVEVDATEYRTQTIEYWRSAGFSHLIELAQQRGQQSG